MWSSKLHNHPKIIEQAFQRNACGMRVTARHKTLLDATIRRGSNTIQINQRRTSFRGRSRFHKSELQRTIIMKELLISLHGLSFYNFSTYRSVPYSCVVCIYQTDLIHTDSRYSHANRYWWTILVQPFYPSV